MTGNAKAHGHSSLQTHELMDTAGWEEQHRLRTGQVSCDTPKQVTDDVLLSRTLTWVPFCCRNIEMWIQTFGIVRVFL